MFRTQWSLVKEGSVVRGVGSEMGEERLLLKGEQWSLRRYRLLKLDSAVGTQEDEVEGPSQGVRGQGLMPQLPLVGSSSRLRQILTTERQCVCVCVCVCVRARARVCMCACTYTQSHFSCVQLFAIPWTLTHQAPLPMGFSRQE